MFCSFPVKRVELRLKMLADFELLMWGLFHGIDFEKMLVISNFTAVLMFIVLIRLRLAMTGEHLVLVGVGGFAFQRISPSHHFLDDVLFANCNSRLHASCSSTVWSLSGYISRNLVLSPVKVYFSFKQSATHGGAITSLLMKNGTTNNALLENPSPCVRYVKMSSG